jgi:hypothetical protein
MAGPQADQKTMVQNSTRNLEVDSNPLGEVNLCCQRGKQAPSSKVEEVTTRTREGVETTLNFHCSHDQYQVFLYLPVPLALTVIHFTELLP